MEGEAQQSGLLKKGEDYAKTISWIRATTSFALLRSALIRLRGTRSTIRKSVDFHNTDIELENIEVLYIKVIFKGTLTGFTTHFKIIVNRLFKLF